MLRANHERANRARLLAVLLQCTHAGDQRLLHGGARLVRIAVELSRLRVRNLQKIEGASREKGAGVVRLGERGACLAAAIRTSRE